MKAHIARAIAILGSQNNLANQINSSQQKISWLLHKAKQVPAELVIPIERATNGFVNRYQLRPDLFPKDMHL